MERYGIVLAIVVGVAWGVISFYMSYEACRLKFPDVPAWACVVRP